MNASAQHSIVLHSRARAIVRSACDHVPQVVPDNFVKRRIVMLFFGAVKKVFFKSQ